MVNNNSDCYSINKKTFSEAYKEVAPGQFVITASVWASQATATGKIKTNDGYTEYVIGDYLVSGKHEGADSYAVGKGKFEEIYEEVFP